MALLVVLQIMYFFFDTGLFSLIHTHPPQPHVTYAFFHPHTSLETVLLWEVTLFGQLLHSIKIANLSAYFPQTACSLKLRNLSLLLDTISQLPSRVVSLE